MWWKLAVTRQAADHWLAVCSRLLILPPQANEKGWFEQVGLDILNDSKQLTEKMRYALRPIIEREALAWAVAEVTAAEIDKINILNASILGMQRALAQLTPQPEHIIVDGNKWKPYVAPDGLLETPANTVVKGDGKYMSIAAASVLAKTYRDDYMIRLDKEFPQYGWAENKGYPTAAHYKALQQYGPSPYHRMTFNLKLSDTPKLC